MTDFRGQRRGHNRAADRNRLGNAEMLALANRLKAAGATELKKELDREIRLVGRPLIAKTREAAARDLPQRGGLAQFSARKPQKVVVRTGARTAGVQIRMRAQGGIYTGNIGHPVFGRTRANGRRVWVKQQVNGEWWDDTLYQNRQIVADGVLAAMRRVGDQLTAQGR